MLFLVCVKLLQCLGLWIQCRYLEAESDRDLQYKLQTIKNRNEIVLIWIACCEIFFLSRQGKWKIMSKKLVRKMWEMKVYAKKKFKSFHWWDVYLRFHAIKHVESLALNLSYISLISKLWQVLISITFRRRRWESLHCKFFDL